MALGQGLANSLFKPARLSADCLDVEKRVLGVALLMFIPFYNFEEKLLASSNKLARPFPKKIS
jgi:hypothetical protein